MGVGKILPCHGCVIGTERREARVLRHSMFYWAMAAAVSLLILFFLMGCVETVSQKATPSPEPTALTGSEIGPEGFAESSQPMVRVHYPADLAVMELNLLSISLSFPEGSADFIEVEVNSHIKASVVPHRNFACLSVPLEIGPNEIHIKAKKEEKIVDEVALHVFRRSDLVGNYEKPPAGFKKDYFHMQARPLCATCHHVLEPTAADKEFIPIETYAAEGLK
ncbi:MAG: hypothetical protein LJE88_11190, partial [Deltaproteobacteria bacterium]|nr:hypothetical protein [Deltaproteobacteria bacterium]